MLDFRRVLVWIRDPHVQKKGSVPGQKRAENEKCFQYMPVKKNLVPSISQQIAENVG